MIPVSILDLAPITRGSDAATALGDSLDLARHAERWGYLRYWLAEHHGMPGVASAATAVALGYIAAGTKTLRVGSGGVMLQNHAPLVIAEQFGTLASLYPHRIDLGIGRAPGADPVTTHALRRNITAPDNFPDSVVELMRYFTPEPGRNAVLAVPGAGLDVPVCLLGSSLYSADLAGRLGLPFGFASHFAPELLLQALAVYRDRFRPSAAHEMPYTMACINVVVADTDEEARRLFTSVEQAFISIRTGKPGQLPPPIDLSERARFGSALEGMLREFLRYAVVGSPETVKKGIDAFFELTRVDELMTTAMIYDQSSRLRSFELLARLCELQPAD